MNWDFLKKVFKPSQYDGPILELELRKGIEAETLLNSEAYSRARMRVRQGIHEKWAASPVSDIEGQHKLRLLLKALDDIEGNLVEEMQTGQLAREQLKRQQEEEKRKRERETRSIIRSI